MRCRRKGELITLLQPQSLAHAGTLGKFPTEYLINGWGEDTYIWLRKSQKNASPNHDVWRLRQCWDHVGDQILRHLY